MSARNLCTPDQEYSGLVLHHQPTGALRPVLNATVEVVTAVVTRFAAIAIVTVGVVEVAGSVPLAVGVLAVHLGAVATKMTEYATTIVAPVVKTVVSSAARGTVPVPRISVTVVMGTGT